MNERGRSYVVVPAGVCVVIALIQTGPSLLTRRGGVRRRHDMHALRECWRSQVMVQGVCEDVSFCWIPI